MEISGAECVVALILAGFRVKRRAAGRTVLMRGAQVVVVPEVLVLSRTILEGILSDADITHDRFLALLAEETTRPDLRTLAE
jgi:hypothetical protein